MMPDLIELSTLQFLHYRELCKKITLKLSGLEQHVLSHSVCESGIQVQLSWVYGLRMSTGSNQNVSLSCSHLKAQPGLKDLLPSSPTRLLAGPSVPR